MDSIQKRILSDPQLAGQVHALSEDPSLREILADPEIADALNRGDYGALLVNPKIHRLAEDPAIRSLTREIAPAD